MLERATLIKFGDEIKFSIDFLLGIIKDARITTLQRVFNISKDELHWQYAEGWNSIGVLLSHIYSVEQYFNIGFLEERKLTKEEDKDINPGLVMGEYIPELITDNSIDFYIEKLAHSREKMIESISKISTKSFHKKRKGYSKDGCNLAWVLYHMAEDEIHHRGQISIIRKLFKHRKQK